MMNRPLSLTRLAGFLIFVLAVFLSAQGQTNKATIVGTVKDPNDALVQGAKVTVTNIATGEVREATSSDDGNYTVPNLEPAKYTVKVEAPGFQAVVFEAVELQTSARLPLDVKFTNVTGGAGIVTITDEGAPVVESETSVRGDVITGRQVTDLPIPQRNFTLLATLSPGVTRPFVGVHGGGNFESGGNPVGTSTGIAASRVGVRPGLTELVRLTTILLMAFDNNGVSWPIGIYPPPDAIAEFKIETSVAPAEGGRAGGGIINTTTRSGGNSVHGTAYEFYQGRVLSALSRSEDPTKLANRNTHQFGGTAGGPLFLPRFGEGGPSIWDGRNRTFWFFYYEGQRNATPSNRRFWLRQRAHDKNARG
jgi:hypothetical protein